jgi:hypothetical protein
MKAGVGLLLGVMLWAGGALAVSVQGGPGSGSVSAFE